MRTFLPAWPRLKPGWYVLAALAVYAAVISGLLVRANAELRSLRIQAAEPVVVAEAPAPPAERGLWLPIPGARLPEDPAHLPNAAREYRRGVNQGFDFYASSAGVPVTHGTPVIAAASGTLTRVDTAYVEQSPEEWEALLAAVAEEGADERQLDRLRGRQVWLQADDGTLLRYGHLSGIRDGLRQGQRVYRGQVLGYVGNSGTDDGVAGSRGGARLHFEVWRDGSFFGQGLGPDEVRLAAASLFTGP